MTQDEAQARLRDLNKAQVSRDTQLDYFWLARFARGEIPNPRAKNLDKLRDYLQRNSPSQ